MSANACHEDDDGIGLVDKELLAEKLRHEFVDRSPHLLRTANVCHNRRMLKPFMVSPCGKTLTWAWQARMVDGRLMGKATKHRTCFIFFMLRY